MPFTLPDHLDLSTETLLREIAERHGFGECSVERLPTTGIFHPICRLGDGAILRIPRHHPPFAEAIPDDRWRQLGPVMGGQHVEA